MTDKPKPILAPSLRERAARIAKLAEAATPGPWGTDDIDDTVVLSSAGVNGDVICEAPVPDCADSLEAWPNNRAFIAAAPEMSALIAEQDAALRRMREALQRIAAYDAPDAHAMIEQARAALAAYLRERNGEAE